MIAIFLIATVILFVAWVVTAEVALPHKDHIKRHHPVIQGLLHLWSFIFVGLLDVPYNVIFGTIYFRQLPNKDGCGWTLTERLQHILKTEPIESWRWQHAYFICRFLISPWDFNHCRMGLGR